jgi:hypothetical protein
MLRRKIVALLFTLYAFGGTASAQMTSVAERDDVSTGLLRDEYLGVKPSAGVVTYGAPNGHTQARIAAALLTDLNISRLFPEEGRWAYFGLTTGVIYSHLGSSGSGFFGSSPETVVTNPGSNFVVIPADFEVGWNPGFNARVAVHTGGNVLYRSDASTVDFGDPAGTFGPVWSIYPNVGLDFDIGLSRGISFSVRPDYTFTPGRDVFTATLGLGISLG